MYSMSPWIIACMCENPYKVPLILFFGSLALNFIIYSLVCPRIFCTGFIDQDPPPEECAGTICSDTFDSIYTQTYTRAGPYFLGMIAAYWHMNPQSEPPRYTLLEILCVCTIIFISFVGGGGEYVFGTVGSLLYRICHRSLYALAWTYLVPGFLAKDRIPWYRPAFCCRGCLGSVFWLPLATVSYSLYVYHIEIIMAISPVT